MGSLQHVWIYASGTVYSYDTHGMPMPDFSGYWAYRREEILMVADVNTRFRFASWRKAEAVSLTLEEASRLDVVPAAGPGSVVPTALEIGEGEVVARRLWSG